jgi:sugar phosphate isomerase/epimerase
MRLEQLAVQMYTVRDFTQTLEGLRESFRKIKAIGYPAVQLSAEGPFPDSDFVAALKESGLQCCATHEPGAEILRETEKVIARLKTLGCKFTAFPIPAGLIGATPFPGEGSLDSLEEVKSLARGLDRAGARMREAGLTLCYHNHAAEFLRYGQKTALELLYENSDPKNLQAELDVYWVQAGGANPVAWCERMKGRLPLLHLKDFGIASDFKTRFAEIGYGNIDMKAVVRAADEAGCEWYIVEQDLCPGDPFRSLELSFQYIQKYLCQS